jgi:hypothetical protein
MRALKLAAAFALALLPQTCMSNGAELGDEFSGGKVAMVAPPYQIKESPPMPSVVVLILCKTVEVPGTSQEIENSRWTGHEGREWATEHAMMQCRRQAVEMYDPAIDPGQQARNGQVIAPADPQPFNLTRCQHSAMILGPTWDVQHKSSKYRFWRVACPVPMMNTNGTPETRDDYIVDWVLPDCGHRDTVVCDVDTEI